MDSVSMVSDLERNSGESNLHAAIEQLDTVRVRRIVGGGGNIEKKALYGATPLVKAVQMDSLEMVDLLLELGANVNTPVFVSGSLRQVFSISLNHALSYAIVRVGAPRLPKLELTTMRHQIIKRLIAAGAELDVAEQFDHMYSWPLQYACATKLWPVVVDLIEAGSKVDFKGYNSKIPLVTAFLAADNFEDAFKDDDWSVVCPSKKQALDLLVEKSPTLRLETTYGSLFKQVIDGCSARVLCILLKIDKPAYGIDEAVDVLNCGARSEIVRIAEANHIILDFDKLPYCLRCSPLQNSIICLLQQIHNPFADAMRTLCYIRRQFAVLRLLLDARATVCRLDENFQQFLHLIRDQLNTNYSHFPQDTLEFCNQILNVIESDLNNPRKLVEICRSRIRHELNMRDLCVHHIRDDVSRIVEKYLLYNDLPQPEEYLVYQYIWE